MDSLPIFVRLHGQPVLLVGDGEAADAKRRLIEAAGGIVVTAPGTARLAFVALDDEAAAAGEAARLRAAGLLVNVVDRPALCDFTVPAIVDRSPVIVAIGTGGASASLAKAIRQRLEVALAPGLGELAAAIRGARAALSARFPTPADRRRALDAAMAEGGPLDPFGDADLGGVGRLLDDGLAALPAEATIRLRSDDPDDLSLRDARLLARADRIVHDTLVPPAILDRARRDAVRATVNDGPMPGLTVFVHRGTLGGGTEGAA